MKTKMTPRLERALRVLYTAFHEGTLDAMACEHCAVGNLCGNTGGWVSPFSFIGLRYVPEYLQEKAMYNSDELSNIEALFIYGIMCREETLDIINKRFENTISQRDVFNGTKTKEEQKELQFKGLCAVVEYLCGLDGVENVMELKGLFETDVQGNAKVGIESVLT